MKTLYKIVSLLSTVTTMALPVSARAGTGEMRTDPKMGWAIQWSEESSKDERVAREEGHEVRQGRQVNQETRSERRAPNKTNH